MLTPAAPRAGETEPAWSDNGEAEPAWSDNGESEHDTATPQGASGCHARIMRGAPGCPPCNVLTACACLSDMPHMVTGGDRRHHRAQRHPAADGTTLSGTMLDGIALSLTSLDRVTLDRIALAGTSLAGSAVDPVCQMAVRARRPWTGQLCGPSARGRTGGRAQERHARTRDPVQRIPR